jgi:iron complex outermembrane recepter protein
MTPKFIRGLPIGLLLLPLVGLAQQAQQIDEVIVTGSLVRGTPLDAALPVEVYTAADLELSGSPTALDFVKSLSVQGGTTGEAYYFSGADLTGNVQGNLRGIGTDKTLTLFGGRRLPTQNVGAIPTGAISRIEILKDGAAVTYGADATGGVINVIPHTRFEGIRLRASYKGIADSDGDHTLSFTGGFGGDTANVMFAADWERRNELSAVDRKFSNQSRAQNPSPWSDLTNLASWLPRGALPANPTAANEWGSPTGTFIPDFTAASCNAVGGVFDPLPEDGGSRPWQQCWYNYAPFYNLVEENDIYRAFVQFTSAVTETSDFRLRAYYTNVYTPYAYGSPSQPVIRGPAIAQGAAFQLFVPVRASADYAPNPHAVEFAQRTGFANQPGYAVTSGFTPALYRAFAHGGLDLFASGNGQSTPRKIDNRYWHVVAELDGELTSNVNYDVGVTFNQSLTTNTNPDIAIYRLQQALAGFGGPNCNAPDLNPNRFGTQNPAMAGQGDCMWFNPFATNFAGQPVLGLANPQYVAGRENSDELVKWIFNERYQENNTWSVTTDFVLSGLLPWSGIELPGGPIAWGAGAQWRQEKYRQSVPDPLYAGNQPCPWPNEFGQVPRATDDPQYNGCTPDGPGPFQFFDINRPDATDQRQYSVFGELNFPITDRIYLTAAVRQEQFEPSGLDATVYKLSGRVEATRNLSFRGSYGTNYQAPAASIVPGNVANNVASLTRAGSNWRGSQVVTRSDISPEEATVWGVGAIWKSDGFTPGSSFQLIVDYFDIDVENELGLVATSNAIANAVFSISPTPGTAVPNTGTALADCSNPLINRVTLNAGTCVQGVTNALEIASIRTEFGNAPGVRTAGFDLQARYGFPLYAGYLDFGLTGTRVTTYEVGDTVLDGYMVAEGGDRLGLLNFAVVGFATPKWRAGFTTNYGWAAHNVRLRLNYVSRVEDARGPIRPAGIDPETGVRFTDTTFGVKGEDWVSADLHYVVDLPWRDGLTLGASIVNVTDRDPPLTRVELGYDPRMGSPLGRTWELSLRWQL